MSVRAMARNNKKQPLDKIQQLELENIEMEERLRSFRQLMAQQKTRRKYVFF
jgi:hypothetical protein